MSTAADNGANPKRIVVVEDDRFVNEVTAAYLVDRGYQVATALDGRKAMQLVESGEFDAVVLDLNLPGLDGRAILAELREHWPDLPAVVVSGLVSPEDEELLRKAGANAVLRKPVKLGELAQVLERLTGNKPEGSR